MAQQTIPLYKFRLFGSVYVYSSQSSCRRTKAAAFVVWAVGAALLLSQAYSVGSFVILAGSAFMLYVLQVGYNRGKAESVD